MAAEKSGQPGRRAIDTPVPTILCAYGAMPVIGVGTKEFVHFRESLESDDNDSDN